jgi:hypothetical protein
VHLEDLENLENLEVLLHLGHYYWHPVNLVPLEILVTPELLE